MTKERWRFTLAWVEVDARAQHNGSNLTSFGRALLDAFQQVASSDRFRFVPGAGTAYSRGRGFDGSHTRLALTLVARPTFSSSHIPQ
jgi:hypothetical protein